MSYGLTADCDYENCKKQVAKVALEDGKFALAKEAEKNGGYCGRGTTLCKKHNTAENKKKQLHKRRRLQGR